MGGTNKDVYVAKLMPMTVLTYAVNYIHFCYLVKTPHCCLCPCGRYSPPLAAQLSPTPTPPYTLIYVICDITVAVKKVAENPAMLASQQKQLQTLAIRLNTVYFSYKAKPSAVCILRHIPSAIFLYTQAQAVL